MAWGPGKYDAECTLVRERVKADGVLIAVFNGTLGTGFAAQLSAELTMTLPKLLRDMAQQIESSGVSV